MGDYNEAYNEIFANALLNLEKEKQPPYSANNLCQFVKKSGISSDDCYKTLEELAKEGVIKVISRGGQHNPPLIGNDKPLGGKIIFFEIN